MFLQKNSSKDKESNKRKDTIQRQDVDESGVYVQFYAIAYRTKFAFLVSTPRSFENHIPSHATFGSAKRDTASISSDSLREAGIIFGSRNSPVRHFVQAEIKVLGGANNSI